MQGLINITTPDFIPLTNFSFPNYRLRVPPNPVLVCVLPELPLSSLSRRLGLEAGGVLTDTLPLHHPLD